MEQKNEEQPSPLERGFFREAEDGSPVFFPWGLTHRGYRLPDLAAKRRATLAVSLLYASATGIGLWTAQALQPLLGETAPPFGRVLDVLALPAAVLVSVLAGYWLWVTRVIERCPASDISVSREARLREAARLAPPWKILALGVVLCGLSALVVWLRPATLWITGLGIVLGLGIVAWSRVLARAAARAAREEAEPTGSLRPGDARAGNEPIG